eukprot:6769621-Lingulodinium_polyedra.AAC.1
MPQSAGGRAATVHIDERDRLHQAQHEAAEREAPETPCSPPHRRAGRRPPGPQGSAKGSCAQGGQAA